MTTIGELSERMSAIETTVEDLSRIVRTGDPNLQTQVTQIAAGISLLKWMVGIVISIAVLSVAVATFYFNSFESRHKVSRDDQPTAMGRVESPKMDAQSLNTEVR